MHVVDWDLKLTNSVFNKALKKHEETENISVNHQIPQSLRKPCIDTLHICVFLHKFRGEGPSLNMYKINITRQRATLVRARDF